MAVTRLPLDPTYIVQPRGEPEDDNGDEDGDEEDGDEKDGDEGRDDSGQEGGDGEADGSEQPPMPTWSSHLFPSQSA